MANKEKFLIDRSRYDQADTVNTKFIADQGLNEKVVREISRQKNESEWMLKKRLDAFALFQKTPLPNFGPSLEKLDLNKIVYFVRPNTTEKKSWKDVPKDIRKTFDRLGIPEAEKKALAGVGAQYDSDIVYHNLKKEWEELGVIFENILPYKSIQNW